LEPISERKLHTIARMKSLVKKHFRDDFYRVSPTASCRRT
jgi:hypothetical protein